MKTLTKSMIIVLLIAMVSTIPSYAQGERERVNRGDRDKEMSEKFAKMKSMKIAYITEHLELTPAEAEKFWPVYNEYEKKRQEVTGDIIRRFDRGDEKPEQISDEDAEKIIKQRFNEEQKLLDLKKEYYKNYKEVIPISKIYKLFEVENNFKRHLLGRMDTPREQMKQEHGAKGKPHRRKIPCK